MKKKKSCEYRPDKTEEKKRWMKILLGILFLGAAVVLGINGYVRIRTSKSIITSKEAAQLEDVDLILVLGCEVKENGEPSDMLADRLRRSVELYDLGASKVILMSGDSSQEYYDEVGPMKDYAVKNGVPEGNVLTDPRGLCTYDSVYRVGKQFEGKKILIVTQKYHLYRALYIADQLGMEAYGVPADYHRYWGQFYREIREILARDKDFFMSIFQPETADLYRP